MKGLVARKLIRFLGWCYDCSYANYVVKNDKRNHYWAQLGIRCDFLREIAIKIDRENAVEQMAHEGWWG